jgi:pantothenate kinase-related protein Tda10
MKIASTLKDEASVSEICNQLLHITSATFEHDVPFVFLEGSSGSGKSQMAFNIMSRLLFSF